MRNVKLVIEYDGTGYNGWQSQRDVPTIQDTLETRLAQILNHKVRISGSGRTDSGVHALGQVANSPHDLSDDFVGEDQVCIFCHTPHNSLDNQTVLWNHANDPLAADIFADHLKEYCK